MTNTQTGISSVKQQNHIKGMQGEAIAKSFLNKNGYQILENNYKNAIGEIDIIAKDATNRIIFIEVKSRQTAKFGYPRESVNYVKQQKIKRVAELYLKTKGIKNCYTRFDVIEILGDKITHLISAF